MRALKKISMLKLRWRLLFFVFFLSFTLFYSQITTPNIYEKYRSDLQAHVNMADADAFYSLIGTIFKFILVLSKDYSNILISVLLSCLVIFSIYETKNLLIYLLEEFDIKIENEKSFFISICLIFVASIYIPIYSPIFFGSFFGIGKRDLITSLSTQPWHNATYNGMRFFALQVMYRYLYIDNNSKIKLKYYIEFLILLFMVNAVKPNFIISFAPMMLGFLMYDLLYSFLHRKSYNLKKIVFLTTCLIISSIVLYFQYKILFSGDTGNSISFTLDIFKRLISIKYFYIITLSGIYFPIFVLFCCIKSKYFPKILFQSWFLLFISFFQRLFLTEIGPREKHGNFYWGGYFFGYFLFLVSIVLVMVMYNNKLITKRLYYSSIILFLAHTFSGVIYFFILLKGTYVLI